MGTCKYCEKTIPLVNLKSHYKEHSLGPKNEEDEGTSKEDRNVQENCISSSSSPHRKQSGSEKDKKADLNYQTVTILGKSFTISKTPDENLVKSLQSNEKGESLINEIGPESLGKSVASSSESQSQPEIMNNLTMVMVKRELLDLDDSDAVTIKKEVDPLAEDSAFSDHPEDRLDKDLEEVFDKVTSDQRTNR